jgi:hypothetical protein
MAAVRKSVRLVDETIELCGVLSRGSEINYSGSLNGMAQRYNILIKDSLPELGEGESKAICAAFNGYSMADNISQDIAGFEWHISESMQYDGNFNDILTHYKIDGEEFKTRIRGWSEAQRLAVIDMTQRFWNAGPKSET